MEERESKSTINMLMNIDSYFGEHQGRLAPIILFLVISSIPLLIYIFFFMGVIPFRWVLVVEVPFAIRVALLTIGDEKTKFPAYLNSRYDEYLNADELVRIINIQDDGMIEYIDGTVMYIITGFLTTFDTDEEAAGMMTECLNQIKDMCYDVYCHLVVDEMRLQDEVCNLSVYTDPELFQERMEFYCLQDEYCKQYSELYRINIPVYAPRYDWKLLRDRVNKAVEYFNSHGFKWCGVASRYIAKDIVARDICAHIDLDQMIRNKYRNTEYFGSSVIYYGDDVPEKYKKKKEESGIENRRVIARR